MVTKYRIFRNFIFVLTYVVVLTIGVQLTMYIDTTSVDAQTDVDAGVNNIEPDFAVGTEVYESPLSNTATPTNVGSQVLFVATADDPNGEDYYLAICKTNAISPDSGGGVPTCPGGSICTSEVTNDEEEASCAYTAQAGDSESIDWFAFVCDGVTSSTCSFSSQGTLSDGSQSPLAINHTPSFTTITDNGGVGVDTPADPGGTITFTSTASDSDSSGGSDNVTLIVCDTIGATTGGCSGIEFCNATSSSNPTCDYSLPSIHPAGNHNYYAYIFDTHGLGSDNNPTLGEYNINNFDPSVSSVVINNGDDITLSDNTTIDLPIEATITDVNSCFDISTLEVSLYRSGVGYDSCDSPGEADDNNCYPAIPCAVTLIDLGDGADGEITINSSLNINTDNLSPNRTKADGEAFLVSAISGDDVTLTGTGSDQTAATSVTDSIAVNDEVIMINIRGSAGATANVGNYEFCEIASISSNTITCTGSVTKTYGESSNSDLTGQIVIIQRVPNYTDVTISSGGVLTTNGFNGTVGGLVAFRASGTVTIDGSIDVNGKGYRGGIAQGGSCNIADGRGESLSGYGDPGGGYANPPTTSCSHGTGGSGGGYGAAGSLPIRLANAGATYGTESLSEVYFGSGGGGGKNVFGGTAYGGPGGGLVLLFGDTFSITGEITANGGAGVNANNGAGGGGSGGSIKISGINISLGTDAVSALGGSGGNSATFNEHDGAGGGDGRIAAVYTSSVSGSTNPTIYAQQVIGSDNCDSENDSSADYVCTIPVWYHADATVATTQFPTENWNATVSVTDTSGSTDTDNAASGVEMLSLLALGYSGDISYGTLDLGEDTGSTNQIVTIFATGNTGIDTEFSGTDMTLSTFVIPVGSQQYALNTFTFGSGSVLSTVSTEQETDLAKTVLFNNPSNANTYWGISIPSSDISSGEYTGFNTLTALQAELVDW